MPRGEFKTMLGLGDRMATDALGALVKRGLLKSDSPQGKVRFGLPQHALRFLFPKLWPEAEADAARPVSLRLGMLAREAWKKDLLSEGQLAGLLQLDRVEIRELIDAFEDEEVDDAAARPLL